MTADESEALDPGAATDGEAADGEADSRPRSFVQTTVISRTVIRIVVPLILLTAVALLLQGHNLPGGGFIGAVLTATAFVLVYVVFGIGYLRETLLGEEDEGPGTMVERYRTLFALGLALAAGSGLVPLLFEYPFLTQSVLFLHGVPLYGELEVASAFAFDLGVYFTVVGGLLTIVEEVGAE